MTISPDYYPPFLERELPAHRSQKMQKALEALYRASVEVHRTLYRLTVLHEITRDREFIASVRSKPVVHPLLTVRGSLAFTVSVSLCAVFDVKDTSASLRRVLKTLADRREEAPIRQLHANTGIDADLALKRIRRLQWRLNSSYISGPLGRLKDLRDKQLAHFDMTPQPRQVAPQMADVDRIFTFAANVVNTATLVATKRLLTTRESYEDARKQARDFTSALMR